MALLEGGVVDTTTDIVDNYASSAEMGSIIDLITKATKGTFEIATSAFEFLMSNPLCAFMVGTGFAWSALSLVRKGLKVAKRT